MGIRFYCEHCDRKLNIKTFLAGKKGICPHCSGRIIIPIESQIPSKGAEKEVEDDVVSFLDNAKSEPKADFAELGGDTPKVVGANPVATAVPTAKKVPDALPTATPAVSDPFDEDPDAVWYVRPPTGGQYGPADGEVMRKWVSEGRVSADSLVWRDGWSDWRNANEEIPALGAGPTPPATNVVARPKPVSVAGAKSEPSKPTRGSASSSPLKRSSQGKDNNWIGMATIIGLGLLVVILGIVLIVLVMSSGGSDEDENANAAGIPRDSRVVVEATL